MTDMFLYLCCLSTCVLLPVVVVDGVGRGQRGCGWAPSATFIYIYDFLFIIQRFKVTSSGCTEEEIKIRFDSLSHFFLQDKTLQRKSNNFVFFSKVFEICKTL